MALKLVTVCVFLIVHQTNTQSRACSGSCSCPTSPSGTTCTLNCDGKDQCKDGTLTCRAGDPCVVNCNGENSCEGNAFIDASGATDVTVNCVGDSACKGNTVINCGTASCAISCGQGTSCEGTSISAPDATIVTCTGPCGSITNSPTKRPTTKQPTIGTTTQNPSVSPISPTNVPTFSPSKNPSNYPSISPTNIPSKNPSVSPTNIPTSTYIPTSTPTKNPSNDPSTSPTYIPTVSPTKTPSNNPSISPTQYPTRNPSISPTKNPTRSPSIPPTQNPANSANPKANSEQIQLQTTPETDISAQMKTQSATMYPIDYILIGCSLLVVIIGCICCGMIYVYFTVKHTKILRDKQNSVGDDKNLNLEGIHAMFGTHTVPQNTATSIHEIPVVPPDDDDLGIDQIVNTIHKTEEPECSSDLTSCSSSNQNTFVAQPHPQQSPIHTQSQTYNPNAIPMAMSEHPTIVDEVENDSDENMATSVYADLTSCSTSTGRTGTQPQYQQQYPLQPNNNGQMQVIYHPNAMPMPLYPQQRNVNMHQYVHPLQTQASQNSVTMASPHRMIPIQNMSPQQNQQQRNINMHQYASQNAMRIPSNSSNQIIIPMQNVSPQQKPQNKPQMVELNELKKADSYDTETESESGSDSDSESGSSSGSSSQSSGSVTSVSTSTRNTEPHSSKHDDEPSKPIKL